MIDRDKIDLLEEYPEEIVCKCVSSKHVPLPKVYYKLLVNGTIVWLCPTTYYNMNKLLTAYRMYDTVPPGSVRKHFSKFVQDLVLELFLEYKGQVDNSTTS